jgi:quinol monooxygenase YgiN
VAAFVLIRQIHPLPGREADAVAWYRLSEALRREAGQTSQMLLRSLVDPSEYRLIQVWTSRHAYDAWRRSAARERLAEERSRLMTSEPANNYEVL